ncbi:putative reverse transcriptase domain-containing protein, partial [Tanacetum coccineum]
MLGLLGHPFEELGSFDVIIGMDWLAKYHALIVCDEKVVRIPYGNETQKYIEKGCHVYLAQVTSKKVIKALVYQMDVKSAFLYGTIEEE